MSTGIMQNLRRNYDTNTNKNKENSNPNRPSISSLHKDCIAQNKPNRQKIFFGHCGQEQKYSFVDDQGDNFISKVQTALPQQKDQEQSSHEIHRYMKQYQYNYYKACDNQFPQQKTKDQSQQRINTITSSNKEFSFRQDDPNIINSQFYLPKSRNSLCQSSKSSFLSIDRKIPSSKNKENMIVNDSLVQKSQQYLKKDIERNKTQFPTSFQKIPSGKNLVTKQQITLIKLLRQQNNEMKMEIQQKNIYIHQLEENLQKYQSNKIHIEEMEQKTIEQLEKIQQLQLRNQEVKKKFLQSQKQLQIYKTLNNKLTETFNSQLSQIPQKILDSKTIEKLSQQIQSKIYEINVYEKFVQKIEEMKTKIETPIVRRQHRLDGSSANPESYLKKQSNLNELWRWLKKIGKQYQILKRRVAVNNQNNQFHIQRR